MFQDTHPLRPAAPTVAAQLLALPANARHLIRWWDAHRAWPASEPARIESRRR